MRTILIILAAVFGLAASGATNEPTIQMLATTNGVVKLPTNITSVRIGGTVFTNLLGFGLAVSNSQLSVDTTQLPAGGGGGGSGTVTSVGGSTTVSGLGFSGSPVTTSGTLSLTGTVAVASGGTGATDASGARTALSLVPGVDVQAYDVDLAAIAALANSGIIVRTGSGTVAARTITGDTEVSVSNGDGVSGNPTLSIGAAIARDSEVASTYAPLASPALTGSPTVPTASAGSSNTVAASTAYVDRAVSLGGGGGGSWDGSPTASGTVSNLTTYSINGIPLTKTIARFTASQNQPPASSYATFGTRNSIAFLAFDPTAQESANFITSVPEGYTNTALTVVLHTASTATSGNYRFGAQIARLTGVDIDSDSYATAVEATTATSGTAGLVTSLTLSSIGIDSATEGEFIQINIYRDVSDAADTVNSNDIELIGVEVRGQ